ncbi:transport-associated protein [Novosphingobium sp. PY1]|nr:transport-associated protein [Novosphingobium sp. PY1]
MNRHDVHRASAQPNGTRNEEDPWDNPRQPTQWRDEAYSQSGDPMASDAPSDLEMYGDRQRQQRGPVNFEGFYEGDRVASRPYRFSGSAGRNSRREYFARRYSLPEEAYAGDSAPYRSEPFYGDYQGDYSSFTSEDFGGRDFYNRGSRASGGLRPSNTYQPTFGLHRLNRYQDDDYGSWRDYGERRGFLQRAGDEIASWFGDDEAAQRREMDHKGRGPSDYARSDERICEDVNESLTRDRRLDASNIRVKVGDCEVTLDGTVDSRQSKRRAEDLADEVTGVQHVQNNLRVARRSSTETKG